MANREIELSYDPFVLPTAQHRAGLAGLLILIESMRRRKIKPLPKFSRSGDGKVSVCFTRESLESVFNDLYDAETGEVESSRKRKDKDKREISPLREEKKTEAKTGKVKTVYIYPQVIPKAGFLRTLGMPDIWLKLWREAIWRTLRGGSPQARKPYEQRAEGKSVREADETSKALKRFEEERAKNRIYTVKIASPIFIGSQASNPERVPFRGKADEAFLLHFWPVVMGVYAPEVVDRDGKTKFPGYVLTVPDVSNVEGFVQEFPDIVARLGNKVGRFGRPADAIISIPQEGGLEYLHHLMNLAKAKAQSGEIEYDIAGVEVYHLEKQDNSLYVLTADRVPATHAVLEEYDAVRGRYRDPLFKGQIILNLLHGESWYRGFDRVFAKQDRKRFIGSQGERFSMDARRYFDSASQERRSA